MTDLDLMRGRAAVITGAGSGIGAALARHAALKLGMFTLVLDAQSDRAEAVERDISDSGGQARAVHLDVTDFDAAEALAGELAGEVSVGLIAANAGVEHTGTLWTTSAEQWHRVQRINVEGAFNIIRAFIPSMLAGGEPGHVVCTSSVGGIAVAPSMSAYIVSKHAVRVLGQCLAAELATVDAPIGVSVLMPGAVSTRIFADAQSSPTDSDAESQRRHLDAMLANEGIKPEQVATMTFEAVARDQLFIHTHPEASRSALVAQTETLHQGLDGPRASDPDA